MAPLLGIFNENLNITQARSTYFTPHVAHILSLKEKVRAICMGEADNITSHCSTNDFSYFIHMTLITRYWIISVLSYEHLHIYYFIARHLTKIVGESGKFIR